MHPDLTGRTARCTYFGMTKPRRRYANDECNYSCYRKLTCECGSESSDTNLAFFKYRGKGSDVAEEKCVVCGYHKQVNETGCYQNSNKPIPGLCPNKLGKPCTYKPEGWEQDEFYCGCRGWD